MYFFEGEVMSETALIADQLRRAFYGEAWHGDSLFEILKGVGAERAAERTGTAGNQDRRGGRRQERRE